MLGINKDKKLLTFSIILANFIVLFSSSRSVTAFVRADKAANTSQQIIHVPGDAPTIQAGIDLAGDGDTVLVDPGVYQENIELGGKTITLASHFQITQDPSFIEQTILDGNGSTVIKVQPSVGPETKIVGFTIRNGDDGIKAVAKLSITNNHFIGNKDAIDYQDGGGFCLENTFENNSDDAIDLDGTTEVTIENNLIRNNGNDGIEIRLHEYSGPNLNIVIRENTISGNSQDGIQIIDYPDISDRVFRIERNLISSNGMVGLGLMDNGESNEDFRAASIPERILLFNNTFVDNPYSITGGDNLIALNNLFVHSTEIALKNVDAGSIAAYNLYWDNGEDHTGSNIDTSTTQYSDPLLGIDYRLRIGSPAVDAGAAHFEWNGEVVLDLPSSEYSGAVPDLGRYEIAPYAVYYAIVINTGAAPPDAPTPTSTPTGTVTSTPTITETTTPTITATVTETPVPSDPVLVGAGDISSCTNDNDEATAALLDGIDGTVFTTGDNVYPDGTANQFAECYEPTWGRHKARTFPSAGNHDYHTPGATGYFDYFGAAAGDPEKGYYSYDLGAWHIIVLNSNLPVDPGSIQEQWLREDLAAHPTACTLAYWHHPIFSSGLHGSIKSKKPIWQALYEAGADVVMNSHDHNYERFAPQDPDGVADPERGIREFVVGTGGKSHYPVRTAIANSEVLNNDTYGVLKLTLHPTSYDWEFIPVAGGTFTDSGSASCVMEGMTTPTSTSVGSTGADIPTPTPQPHGSALVSASIPIANSHPSNLNWAQVDAPIFNPQLPSTLLLPGTTSLNLSVESTSNTICAFNIGADMPYEEMTPFEQGAGSTVHQTTLNNLNPDPNVVNNVFVRCASEPDYLLQLKYRSLSQANPSYPRTGNLWGWWDLFNKGLAYMARIDLWLGAAQANADEIRELRLLNPDIRILTNINAVNGPDSLPDDYYLKDINGNRFEVWPNSYRLNLTKPHVAEYLANYAYQRMLDQDLMFDGVFFDNVFTTQSWRKYDMHGNRFLVDSDENGVEDDPEVFDDAWKAGVFHELETFRSLMPHAILSGHGMDIYEPGIAEIFNGISFLRRAADVLEGEMLFADLWDEYHAWQEIALQPRVTMFESSPPDQIAYGYGYSPWEEIPPSTLEFARTYYPYVRFGLALTLMSDGYFAHEFGDTWHGNDWWYDELNYDLGLPREPAKRVDLGFPTSDELIVNGGFEAALDDSWRLLVTISEGNVATISLDTTDKAVGVASARIDVTASSGLREHVKLAQYNRSLDQGVIYEVSFWAKSDIQRTITLSAQKSIPDELGYGLRRSVNIGTDWKEYKVSFEANATANDARIQFLLGEAAGTVWLDDVSMVVRPPDVYQRKFTHGMVLLNGSKEQQAILIGPGYRRLQGQQAPLYETILDDGQSMFSTTGNWTSVKYDSGELQETGPFYHCWKETCRERSGSQGEARWDLEIQATDTYTITAWWPAAPEADTWNQNVTYEVVVGDQVIASATFDQRSGGEEWHFVAEVPLSPGDENFVRMYCLGEAPCLADALHLRSRARYNDGSYTEQVTLQPLDGIILSRIKGTDVYLPLIFTK